MEYLYFSICSKGGLNILKSSFSEDNHFKGFSQQSLWNAIRILKNFLDCPKDRKPVILCLFFK